MRILYRLLIVSLIFAALLFSGIFILKKTVLTSEKLKALAIPKAEKAIGRKIEVGEIELGLLGNVVLKDVHVKQKDKTSDLFSAEYLSARFKLLPIILKRKFEISSVKVNEGHLTYKFDSLPVKFSFEGKVKFKGNFPDSGKVYVLAKTTYKGKPYTIKGDIKLKKREIELNANGNIGGENLKIRGKTTFENLTEEGIKKGKVNVKKLLYKGVNVENLNLKYFITDKSLNVDILNGEMADGHIKGNLNFALKTNLFKGNFEAEEINLEKIKPIITKTSIRKCIIQKLDAKLTFKGTKETSIKKTLSGIFNFKLRNIHVKQGKFARELERFIGIDKLYFEKGNGSGRILNGNGKLNAEFYSKEISISVQNGKFTTFGKLDMPLTVTISGEAAKTAKKRLPILKTAEKSNGDVEIHLRVIGTTKTPIIFPESRIEEKVKSIPAKIKGLLNKLFN